MKRWIHASADNLSKVPQDVKKEFDRLVQFANESGDDVLENFLVSRDQCYDMDMEDLPKVYRVRGRDGVFDYLDDYIETYLPDRYDDWLEM